MVPARTALNHDLGSRAAPQGQGGAAQRLGVLQGRVVDAQHQIARLDPDALGTAARAHRAHQAAPALSELELHAQHLGDQGLDHRIRDFLREPCRGDPRRGEYYKRLAETHRRRNEYVVGFATHRVRVRLLGDEAPLERMITQVNSPLYACTDLYWRHHVLAGDELKTNVYTFNDTLDGPGGLTANVSGATTFNGAVGGATALAYLTTDAPGTTAINGGLVTTSGAQMPPAVM